MKPSKLTPTKLRIILSACLLLLIATGVALFTFGYQLLADHSGATRTTAAQAQASSSVLQDLQRTKVELEDNSETVTRASQIVAESTSYMYQDQIIRDINNFAQNSGISVTNISFADAVVTPTAPAAPAATETPATGVTGTESPIVATGPVGVKSMTATVTFKNPVSFPAILKFIHAIEDSLFKMSISQVTLSRTADAKSPDDVTSDALTIEVYVR